MQGAHPVWIAAMSAFKTRSWRFTSARQKVLLIEAATFRFVQEFTENHSPANSEREILRGGHRAEKFQDEIMENVGINRNVQVCGIMILRLISESL